MDVFTLIASYMSINELAAQTVLKTITLLTYMIPNAVALPAVILVGNYVGAKKIESAKFYAKMCFLTALIWAIGSVFLINVLKNPIISVFNTQ
jgi:Na+-driven multidrug efflux pump